MNVAIDKVRGKKQKENDQIKIWDKVHYESGDWYNKQTGINLNYNSNNLTALFLFNFLCRMTDFIELYEIY